MTAYISDRLYLPVSLVPPVVRESVLTVRPRRTSERQKTAPAPLVMYTTETPGYIGVPLAWGLQYYPNLEIEDRTVEAPDILIAPRVPDPHHPNASPEQPKFIQDMLQAVLNNYATLVVAGTGTGKTVSALYCAAILKQRTLVVVPNTTLLDQWILRIVEHLGFSEDDIGVIQQDRCDVDKPIVLALLPSLVQRFYGTEVYNTFGFVIWDEVHRMGAATFSQSIALFPAKFKLAMTATEKRKDGADKVYLTYFGAPSVVSKEDTLPCEVRVLRYHTSSNYWGESRDALVSCLATDKGRNQWILQLVARVYDAGRYLLVIGDNIKHLQDLIQLCLEAGIPSEHIGQFTKSYYPKDGAKWSTKSKAVPTKELRRIMEDKNICIYFATYGSFKDGTDISRLDAGIDITPRADGEQVIGRIRRREPGKPKPVWYTIDDTKYKRLSTLAKSRIKDYVGSGNVEVIYE